MKNIIIAALVSLLAIGTFADGDRYLYWMVHLDESESAYAFSYATVRVGDIVLDNYANGDSTKYVGASSLPNAGTSTDSYYAYDIANYVNSTFLFELFDAENNLVAYKSVAGSILAEGKHFGSTMSQITPYVVSGVTPEPTSGMLLLLGIAGLALKRKRA